MTGALAPTKPLMAADRCDRCGAQAYIRATLPVGGELLFCAHHGRQHVAALRDKGAEIQDESARLSETPATAANGDR
ncbi:DUF7455 domain-containing protein [Bailinhaonella thermotolerans]|uniref:DUF7455 domain-containing protein n=1 Tax=Bailinhaonella thermotolerans TaxID=1070861 RepID=A0A3A4BHY7_9ACTN|nr:hypothetical protein [Bailinhaonella thermotolerans]RJL34412.1 hypothetical protein D5H75_08230 [Bailinhaonella thermotolerans]